MRHLILLCLLFAGVAQATSWTRIFDELAFERFSGAWKSDGKWKGWLCEGSYQYEASVKGEVFDTTYEAEGETVALLKTEIRDLGARAKGSYQASKTLCIPFHIGVSMNVDNFFATVRVRIEGPTMEKISVRILETKFGTIHFGKAVSPKIEKVVTKVINSALHSLWSSWLGEWISNKISPFLEERKGLLPDHAFTE